MKYFELNDYNKSEATVDFLLSKSYDKQTILLNEIHSFEFFMLNRCTEMTYDLVVTDFVPDDVNQTIALSDLIPTFTQHGGLKYRSAEYFSVNYSFTFISPQQAGTWKLKLRGTHAT